MKNSDDDNKQVLNISRIDFNLHIERLIALKKSHHSSPKKSIFVATYRFLANLMCLMLEDFKALASELL